MWSYDPNSTPPHKATVRWLVRRILALKFESVVATGPGTVKPGQCV
jgi:hypothetical protein